MLDVAHTQGIPVSIQMNSHADSFTKQMNKIGLTCLENIEILDLSKIGYSESEWKGQKILVPEEIIYDIINNPNIQLPEVTDDVI